MTYEISEYNATVSALALLREKHAGPFDTTTKDGMALAKEARAEVRGYRTSVEKLRVELKAPALERARLIDAEAKRLTAELSAIEEPIDTAIKAEETRKAREKEEKARAEAARVAELRNKVEAIRQRITAVAGKDAATIGETLGWANAYQPDPGEFMEFLSDAIAARNEGRAMLETMLVDRQRADADRAELERLRAQVAALPPAPPPELPAAPVPPANGTKTNNGRGKKAALTPVEKLIAAVRAGNSRFEDAIQTAYQIGYDDGVVAATTAK
ncbi:MAG: hypothetical protein P9F19_01540 [Candidatus Contendobacter sp.]|nr:hypothetical protein [Candidatus Contendobacter sp.]MDG4556073.1 hypothetical protein [Candidatus Contendobacter sp.]